MTEAEKKSEKKKKKAKRRLSVASDAGSTAGADAAADKRQKVLTPIAVPLAGKKLHKKVYKVVKLAAGDKLLRRGVKETVKAIRKQEKGLVVLAGDVSPIDVITHLPVYCEDNGIPYIYVDSKADLGTASTTKRPTSCVLISTKSDKGKVSFQKKLDEVVEEVKALTPTF